MLAIAILSAGIAGVAARWSLGIWLSAMAFPIATLAVNGIGGFFMGFLHSQSHLSANLKMVLGVGFLGAFTTFSAFSWETLKLMQGGQLGWAMVNIIANNVVALGLCALGYFSGRFLQ